MDHVLASLQADWQAFLNFSPRLLYAAIVLLIFIALAALVGRAVSRVFNTRERLRGNERLIRVLIVWALRMVGVLLALGVMGFTGIAASVLATGGVVAIVLGFAFREVGENLLAGIFLTFSRPFELGDLVKTGDLTGTVRSIDIRSVHIRTADACDVFIPSAQIFRESLYNYTRDGLRRPDFSVGVAYHDAPDEVIGLLQEAVGRVPDVLENPAPLVTVEQFAANFIEYRVYFWMDTNLSSMNLANLSNVVKIRCWKALSEARLTFSTDVAAALEIKSMPVLSLDRPADPRQDS